jgi:hypothetical protein
MRVHTKVGVSVLAAVAFAIPAWAAHKMSTQLSLNHPTKIGDTTLKPGNYRLVVNSGQNDVRVMKEGRLLATVPGKWVNLKNRSPYSDVVINKNQVKEIDFSGKTQAIRVD